MKTFTISVTVAALFSYVAANPVPADYDIAEYQGPNTNYTDPVLSPRCTFNDGHGPVACTAFSVVFGDGSLGGDPTQVQIMGSNFKVNYGLNCGKSGDFTGYKSPLPYVLSIRPGNACSWKPNSESYDGTVSRPLFVATYLPTLDSGLLLTGFCNYSTSSMPISSSTFLLIHAAAASNS